MVARGPRRDARDHAPRPSPHELLGTVSLRRYARDRRAELGYWLAAPAWGYGFATEACRAIARLRVRRARPRPDLRAGARREPAPRCACSTSSGWSARASSASTCARARSSTTSCSTGCCATSGRAADARRRSRARSRATSPTASPSAEPATAGVRWAAPGPHRPAAARRSRPSRSRTRPHSRPRRRPRRSTATRGVRGRAWRAAAAIASSRVSRSVVTAPRLSHEMITRAAQTAPIRARGLLRRRGPHAAPGTCTDPRCDPQHAHLRRLARPRRRRRRRLRVRRVAAGPPGRGPGARRARRGDRVPRGLRGRRLRARAPRPDGRELRRRATCRRCAPSSTRARDLGPLWAEGRALFRADAPVADRGRLQRLVDRPRCAPWRCARPTCSSRSARSRPGSGRTSWSTGSAWSLDPHDPAFAYDDFAGNPDGRNSVLNTPDSGRGHLVTLERACSTALGNCRDVTAYLPPGYDGARPARRATYPVLFMHDGQNVWDDHDCCFGHTGWELNVALDAEIAAGRVAPVIVIAAASTTARNNEYGLSPAAMTAFMAFQVTELQPAALAQVRWDGRKRRRRGQLARRAGLDAPRARVPADLRRGGVAVGRVLARHDDGTALRDRLPGARQAAARDLPRSRWQRREQQPTARPTRSRFASCSIGSAGSARTRRPARRARTRSATTPSPARPTTSSRGRPGPGGSCGSCSRREPRTVRGPSGSEDRVITPWEWRPRSRDRRGLPHPAKPMILRTTRSPRPWRTARPLLYDSRHEQAPFPRARPCPWSRAS